MAPPPGFGGPSDPVGLLPIRLRHVRTGHAALHEVQFNLATEFLGSNLSREF